MPKLQGKSCIVTGASSGIGRAIARGFAAEGASLVLADCSEGPLRAVAAELGAVAVSTDVSQPAEVQRLVERALQAFGRLDVLVNNAGIEGEQAPTADCSLENFDRVLAVNLKGTFLGMKFAIPAMLKAGGGSIVNVASVAALVGFANIPAYCASKGGVLQLTRTAALEYATRNVRVNAVCPGVIATPMVERFIGSDPARRAAFEALEPVRRFGTPEEIAQLVLFLASADASFCTGAPFIADGGLVAA